MLRSATAVCDVDDGGCADVHSGGAGGSGTMIVLDKVFRQRDSKFRDVLNELRRGVVSEQSKELLARKVQEFQFKTSNNNLMNTSVSNNNTNNIGKVEVAPTKIFSTNKDVDEINQSELKKLLDENNHNVAATSVKSVVDGYKNIIPPHRKIVIEAIDEGEENYLRQLKQGTKAPEVLELVIGAQVKQAHNHSMQKTKSWFFFSIYPISFRWCVGF